MRELEGVLVRALVCLSRTDILTSGDIDPLLAPAREGAGPDVFPAGSLMELRSELERKYLTQLFFRVKGDPEKMMKDVGLKRTQLYAWFSRLGLDVRELRKRL